MVSRTASFVLAPSVATTSLEPGGDAPGGCNPRSKLVVAIRLTRGVWLQSEPPGCNPTLLVAIRRPWWLQSAFQTGGCNPPHPGCVTRGVGLQPRVSDCNQWRRIATRGVGLQPDWSSNSEMSITYMVDGP